MTALDHFIQAAGLTYKLREDFASVAKVWGPHRAFEIFAVELTKPYVDKDAATERKMVEIVRALFDDYVATA